jgi:hypothetical protein
MLEKLLRVSKKEGGEHMLEKLLRIYAMSMAYDVRSPMPHLVGPPGCGKSTYVEQLTELLGVRLHIINVSRLSPLDVEGVQMPHGQGEDMVLKMLPATFWTSLKEGDVLLMDEFLRGFPEVFNALLDIFTSRRVGAFRLPKVVIIGASNSVISYDAALEDRLLHLPVPDPRTSTSEARRLAKILIDSLGLLPDMLDSVEMRTLLDEVVLPTYNLLDVFKRKGSKPLPPSNNLTASLRNLIGQAQLRTVTTPALRDLLRTNNMLALKSGKYQYILGFEKSAPGTTSEHLQQQLTLLMGNPRLTPLQALNLEMNLQLLGMEEAMHEPHQVEEETVF